MLRERIIQQATDLFSFHGIKNVSMDDLASSLGVSKRTIYQYFKNKEDILKSCILSFCENRDRRIIEIMAQSENVVCGCLQIINDYKYTRFPAAIFWEDIYKYYPEVYQYILEDVRKSNIYLKRLLKEGIKDNFFRKKINFDETVLLLDISTCIKICGIYSVRVSLSRTELISNIMVNMLRGISTSKGIEIIDKYIADLPNSNN
ncbi:transcriptional regulator, TetR family [Porphyromonadaceae bacterium KH3R12]|uniref:TetR/AcrR family transcriptional regulator n=1 Tax=Proteiniphilum saccharofermentans TaxID=1642647 RepID=UPI00089CDB29|nr:TetR/AcrR family transcriptional regulator [Proteiniphilum saccharofermentans]SDZ97013.1 transcriptional regulator, TetR family [Porphyromonadaceae bacterium KH3R12]